MRHPVSPPVPSTPPPAPIPGGSRRRPWWRRGQVPYILALVVLLPVTAGVPWWLERESARESGSMPAPPVEIPTGAAEFSDVHWEFRGAAVGAVDESSTIPPPEGTELVDAVFTATPLTENGANLLAQKCDIRAEDDAGREWRTSAAGGLRDALDDTIEPGRCVDDDFEPLAVDEEHVVVATYEIPEDAVDSLSFVLTMDRTYFEPSDVDLEEFALELEWDPDDLPEPPYPQAVRFREPVL
ncbi:hypothetical protein J4H86_16065 [Spiractinospora alimapuensis]|uniref:hypothetical protein n=1 Tax=Spiractinospora alimapuensis TaxID=2820884 RepID=UPI001F3BA953|nr:hypothetical protein [Spiractinospora alimapuensis]QVQ50437.1 hypothetical protein J4H86_16065 [Spiractinospora alimapuensis]